MLILIAVCMWLRLRVRGWFGWLLVIALFVLVCLVCGVSWVDGFAWVWVDCDVARVGVFCEVLRCVEFSAVLWFVLLRVCVVSVCCLVYGLVVV